MKIVKNIKGLTIAELMVAVVVLGMISSYTFSIYTNFFDSTRDLRAGNLVYEEARFAMERIVKEVRNGTVDYEEYFNQSRLKNELPDSYVYLRNETYADDYCAYSRQFYNTGTDGEIGTLDDEPSGLRTQIDPVDGLTPIPPAVGRLDDTGTIDEPDPIQNDLFLININGDQRTFLKRIVRIDEDGNELGRIGMLKLDGKDFGVDHLDAFDPMLDGTPPGINCSPDSGEGDGRIDTWICADGFPCQKDPFTNPAACDGILHNIIYDPNTPDDSSFLDITPPGLDIVDIKFIVAPMDDPRKAYANNTIQIQPHVTIRVTAQAAPALTQKFRTDNRPSIVLESTISARAYNEIITECNLKQCTDGLTAPKSCPLTAGVCGSPSNPPAQQSCTNYVWSGCTPSTYESYADTEYGLDNTFPTNPTPRTFYENGSEFRSCNDDYDDCETACALDSVCIAACLTTSEICKTHRCTDGFDNDCSGAADDADNACNFFLCNDGVYTPGVESTPSCIDVGGLCSVIRPQQEKETACSDGHDNDCDGFADQFDADCVKTMCSNGAFNADTDFTLYTSSPVDLFLRLDYPESDYLLNAVPADHVDDTLNECFGGGSSSPDIGGICELCVDSATGNGACECGTAGCTTTKILPGHDQVATEDLASCTDGLDNDCDGQADELDSDCQLAICSNSIKNCNLAPSSYTPANYLLNYADITCIGYPLNGNDEVCTDVGGVCDGLLSGGGIVDHTFYDNGDESDASGSPLTPEQMCNDGLDNDCDGLADWQDNQCCPQGDADGYPADSSGGGATTCFLPPGTDLDCNDLNTNISPVATEICNDFVYTDDDASCPGGVCTFPGGFAEAALAGTNFPAALLGQVIDNNCSAFNGLTASVADSNDPQCCIDLDGDGYGISSAYIYRDGPLGCTGGAPAAPVADCDDTSALIRPNGNENTGGTCFDQSGGVGNEFPINNNCSSAAIGAPYNTTVPQSNHIDWYRNRNTTWLAWYAGSEGFDDSAYVGGNGIEMAAELELFEPACCNLTAMEICDDLSYGAQGSDENCSGLEGYADNYCLTEDDASFFDNFTSTDYIAAGSTDAEINQNTTAGTISIDLPTDVGAVVTSLPAALDLAACSAYDASISLSSTTPGTTSIRLQLSDDGGATWCGDDDCAGDWIDLGEVGTAAIAFDQPNLRWRAELSGDTTSSPTMDDITLSYANCTP